MIEQVWLPRKSFRGGVFQNLVRHTKREGIFGKISSLLFGYFDFKLFKKAYFREILISRKHRSVLSRRCCRIILMARGAYAASMERSRERCSRTAHNRSCHVHMLSLRQHLLPKQNSMVRHFSIKTSMQQCRFQQVYFHKEEGGGKGVVKVFFPPASQ